MISQLRCFCCPNGIFIENAAPTELERQRWQTTRWFCLVVRWPINPLRCSVVRLYRWAGFKTVVAVFPTPEGSNISNPVRQRRVGNPRCPRPRGGSNRPTQKTGMFPIDAPTISSAPCHRQTAIPSVSSRKAI